MTPFAQESVVKVRLRDYLGNRLAPLAVLLVVVTSFSAPIAFYVLGRRALQVQVEATARQVAETIRRDAQERPTLWKYDSAKLLDHIRSYERVEGVEHIDVVDAQGQRIDDTPLPAGLGEHRVLWAEAELEADGQVFGAVWVAASLDKLRRDTLVLFAAFVALGAFLGTLTYALPMRAMGRAEAEITALLRRLEESQSALAALNEGLEQQVEARSSELKQAYRDLRELSSRAVKLQEAERRGIARELHDSTGQALTAIRIHLQLMADLLAQAHGQDSKLVEMARRTTGMVDGTVEEIRRAVNRLGPAVLDDVGLRAAVVRAVDDLTEATGIEADVSVELPEKLDASVETTCYRLVQESLTNVARHAQAQTLELQIAPVGDPEVLAIDIRDDGRGFAPDEVRPGSRGLLGMRERVELMGGSLRIESQLGAGTSIAARIPLG